MANWLIKLRLKALVAQLERVLGFGPSDAGSSPAEGSNLLNFLMLRLQFLGNVAKIIVMKTKLFLVFLFLSFFPFISQAFIGCSRITQLAPICQTATTIEVAVPATSSVGTSSIVTNQLANTLSGFAGNIGAVINQGGNLSQLPQFATIVNNALQQGNPNWQQIITQGQQLLNLPQTVVQNLTNSLTNLFSQNLNLNQVNNFIQGASQLLNNGLNLNNFQNLLSSFGNAGASLNNALNFINNLANSGLGGTNLNGIVGQFTNLINNGVSPDALLNFGSQLLGANFNATQIMDTLNSVSGFLNGGASPQVIGQFLQNLTGGNLNMDQAVNVIQSGLQLVQQGISADTVTNVLANTNLSNFSQVLNNVDLGRVTQAFNNFSVGELTQLFNINSNEVIQAFNSPNFLNALQNLLRLQGKKKMEQNLLAGKPPSFRVTTLVTTVCTSQDLIRWVNNLIIFITYCLAPWAATFGFAFGAYNLILAGGDPGKIERGKKIFFGSAIGLFIALAAGAILNTILRALGAPPLFP